MSNPKDKTAELRALLATWLYCDDVGCDCGDGDYYAGPACVSCQTKSALACQNCGGWGQDTTDGNTTFPCITCGGTGWAPDVREQLKDHGPPRREPWLNTVTTCGECPALTVHEGKDACGFDLETVGVGKGALPEGCSLRKATQLVRLNAAAKASPAVTGGDTSRSRWVCSAGCGGGSDELQMPSRCWVCGAAMRPAVTGTEGGGR